MKVAVFGPYALWNPHFETDLELAEGHLLQRHEVTWFMCDGELNTCEPNAENYRDRCLRCVGRREAGLALLSAPVVPKRHLDFLRDDDRRRVDALPRSFRDIDDLRSLRLDDLDLGYAVASTLYWAAGSVDLDFERIAERINVLVRSTAQVYLGMCRYLREERPDRVYVFNGRMSIMRAVLRACQGLGVSCHVHERGGTLGRYQITEDVMSHEIDPFEARVRGAWEAAEPPEAEKGSIARAWYAQRAKGHVGVWHSYTDAQEEGALPSDWRADRHNVAVYTSSEFEYASIGAEYSNPIFKSTVTEGLRELMAVCRDAAPKVHFTVRLHPNPRTAGSSAVETLLSLDVPNVTIIAPDSSVSTYALMAASDKVLVTGSTAGIEAAYAGTPTILAGRIPWAGLGSVYTPQKREALVDLLSDEELPALDPHGAEMFGYYMATVGTPFRWYSPAELMKGTWKGAPIEAALGYRLRSRVARWRRSLSRLLARS